MACKLQMPRLKNAATVAIHFFEGINIHGEILQWHFRYAGQELLTDTEGGWVDSAELLQAIGRTRISEQMR